MNTVKTYKLDWTALLTLTLALVWNLSRLATLTELIHPQTASAVKISPEASFLVFLFTVMAAVYVLKFSIEIGATKLIFLDYAVSRMLAGIFCIGIVVFVIRIFLFHTSFTFFDGVGVIAAILAVIVERNTYSQYIKECNQVNPVS